MAALLAGLGSSLGIGSAAGATGLGGMLGQLIGGSIAGDLNHDTTGAFSSAMGLPQAGANNNPATSNTSSNPSGTQNPGPQGVSNPYQTIYQPAQQQTTSAGVTPMMGQVARPSFGSVLSNLLGR